MRLRLVDAPLHLKVTMPRGALVLALVTVMLMPLSWAMACVPQPFVWLEPKSSGQAGSKVTVTGLRFPQGKTEIRWNGLDGPLLASPAGPEFSAPITVPAVPAGLYTVLVVSRAPNGNVGDVSRAMFQVDGSASTGRTSPYNPQTSQSARSSRSLAAAAGAGAGAALLTLGFGGVLLFLSKRRKGPSGTERGLPSDENSMLS